MQYRTGKAFGLVYRCRRSLNQKYAWLLFTSPNFSLTFDLLLSSLDQVIRPLRRSPGGALPCANMSTAQYLEGARVNIPSELSAFPACSVTYVHVCVCEAQIAAISTFTISSILLLCLCLYAAYRSNVPSAQSRLICPITIIVCPPAPGLSPPALH